VLTVNARKAVNQTKPKVREPRELQLQQLMIRGLLKLSICTPAGGRERLHRGKIGLVRRYKVKYTV